MTQMTGCISVGTTDGSRFPVKKVIEYSRIDLALQVCIIDADIFLFNDTSENRNLRLIHPGSMTGAIRTRDAWGEVGAEGWSREMADRIITLHADDEPIERLPAGAVRLGDQEYSLWVGSAEVVVGQAQNSDVPFTMWELGPFLPGQRYLIRIQMAMNKATFAQQVGDGKVIYAYGDSILHDQIEMESLPAYSASGAADANDYRIAFDALLTRIVPDEFEWLLVSPRDRPGEWKTTALTYNFYPRLITSELHETTHWFVADYIHAGRWKLEGNKLVRQGLVEAVNAFTLKIEPAEPIHAGR